MVAAFHSVDGKVGSQFEELVHWYFLRRKRVFKRLELQGCYAGSSDGAGPRE